MSWASDFARRCTSIIGIRKAHRVAIILIPSVFAPDVVIRERSLRIILARAVFLAELLAEFDGASRARFNAETAGDAVLRIDFRGEGAAGEVRRIEEHRGS